MLAYLLRRLLLSVPLLFLVSILTFVVVALIPGDPAVRILGAGHTEAEYHALGSGFDDLHVEQLVDVVPPAREKPAVVGVIGRRRGHRRMLPGALLWWPRG